MKFLNCGLEKFLGLDLKGLMKSTSAKKAIAYRNNKKSMLYWEQKRAKRFQPVSSFDFIVPRFSHIKITFSVIKNNVLHNLLTQIKKPEHNTQAFNILNIGIS
jgi:hypothetical protein